MHGGMALLDVHQDYLRFSGEESSQRRYAAEFYGGFLEYVRRRYGRCFWNPLPRELAAFVKGRQATPVRSYLSDELQKGIGVRTVDLERVS